MHSICRVQPTSLVSRCLLFGSTLFESPERVGIRARGARSGVFLGAYPVLLCALSFRVHPDRGYFAELSVLEQCRGRALPVLQP